MIARRSRRLAKHGGSDRRGCAIAGTARYAPRTQPAPPKGVQIPGGWTPCRNCRHRWVKRLGAIEWQTYLKFRAASSIAGFLIEALRRKQGFTFIIVNPVCASNRLIGIRKRVGP